MSEEACEAAVVGQEEEGQSNGKEVSTHSCQFSLVNLKNREAVIQEIQKNVEKFVETKNGAGTGCAGYVEVTIRTAAEGESLVGPSPLRDDQADMAVDLACLEGKRFAAADDVRTSAVKLVRVSMCSDVPGQLDAVIGDSVWQILNLSQVTSLRCNDGFQEFWKLKGMEQLKDLDLSASSLVAVPPQVGKLTSLEKLTLNQNYISILPREIGVLEKLKELHVEHNAIAILPGELSKCVNLEVLSLEHNRLTNVLLNFRSLKRLRKLMMNGNPLESIPELVGCLELKVVSLLDFHIRSTDRYEHIKVSYTEQNPSSSLVIKMFERRRPKKVQVFLDMVFNRSTGNHPLFLGAVRTL